VTPGLLATADGAVFRGRSVGARGIVTGEVVFNTSMTGYQEIVTDPSYAGQVVVLTAPHVGNYGVAAEDDQADRTHLRALIVRSMSPVASSWRADGAFDDYLKERGVVALSDLDTRRLTRRVRDRGAMPAAVGVDVDEAEVMAAAAAAPAMDGQNLADAVSTRAPYEVAAGSASRGHIVAIDLGIKRMLLRRLSSLGLDVTVVPSATSASDILAANPDGVFVSNGPGDPEPLEGAVATVRTLLGKVPVFGICLGHQVLGLALGARTYKLPFGHHGGNHPVKRLADGGVEITAQNHGFAVDLDPSGTEAPPWRGTGGGVPPTVDTEYGTVVPTHVNLNDGTLEGLSCPDLGAFSVQYHPEAAPGPNDAVGLFDRFADAVRT